MCLAVSVCINTTFCAPPCTTHDCHHFPGLKTWFLTHWYVPFWTHLTLTLSSDALASYTSSKRSKTGKIHPKIRYNPKIRCKHVRICVVETYMFRGECPGKFATFVHKHACLLPVLHAVKVALAIFYQQKQIFTGIYLYNPLYKGMASPGKMLPLTSFCVAVRLQPSPCLNFDSFLSFYAYKLTMYQHPQQKYKKCTY